MHRIKFYVALTLFCSIWLTSSVTALVVEGQPFELSADEVEYDNNSNNIFATGNVHMGYLDYAVISDHFQYNSEERQMRYQGNVEISQQQRSVEATNFTYNFADKTGDATAIRANIEGTIAGAKKAHVSPTFSVIEDVYFTTCNLPHKHHYNVAAKKVYFYPESGDIIAEHNTVYLYGAPIFKFPSYIYNGKGTIKPVGGESSSGGNGINVAPELGSNGVDGTFARWNWGYVISPKSTGSFTLSTTSVRGFRGGSTFFTLSDGSLSDVKRRVSASICTASRSQTLFKSVWCA